jgi:signal transduction histidine kinase
MPTDLRDQLIELEEWAQANRRDAIQDSVGFWSLKVPAIIASASAGLWAHFGLTTVSVVAGAIASLCVIVDGIHPRGMLRNTHLRAYHDIRILLTHMVTEWRSRNSNAKEDNIARRIIRDAEAERQKIAADIRDAVTALRYEDKA